VARELYAQLPHSARYEVARMLGRLTRSLPAGRWALFGPGRWCTTSPELGLPTTFAEINRAVALAEIVEMHSGLTPEVSRGIHLFNELVATNMLYLAIFPGHPHNSLARERLMDAPNRLTEVLPDAARWAGVVRLLDARAFGGATAIELHADSRRQRALVYVTGTRRGASPNEERRP
ncbi:MAG: pyruvate, phosphate dikinase, partial [Kiritimatiellaeota bacterium]|nr:pyruvate, phosphate dikinase [Kiritimatiellota bacterium]